MTRGRPREHFQQGNYIHASFDCSFSVRGHSFAGVRDGQAGGGVAALAWPCAAPRSTAARRRAPRHAARCRCWAGKRIEAKRSSRAAPATRASSTARDAPRQQCSSECRARRTDGFSRRPKSNAPRCSNTPGSRFAALITEIATSPAPVRVPPSSTSSRAPRPLRWTGLAYRSSSSMAASGSPGFLETRSPVEVPEQRRRAVPERVARRLVARHREQQHGRGQFLVGQPVPPLRPPTVR